MPITTNEQLSALQDQARKAVAIGSGKALDLLLEALPEGRAKHNQTLVLAGRNNDILSHEIGNTLAPDLLAILRNELRKDILVFTDHLTLADFGPKPANRPELKPGHLLYKVPPVMKLRETHPCIIRIAHQLNQVLSGIEMDESVGLEQVSISEVMEIEILDPSAEGDPAFEIVLLSDGEQFVDEYSATEWVFNVRPLRAGSHSLVLKISVLLVINGKERTKNIVHQRPINVKAEAVVADVGFTRPSAIIAPLEAETSEPPASYPAGSAGGALPQKPISAPAPPPPPPPVPTPAPMPAKRYSRKAIMSTAAAILLLVFASFWMLTSTEPENTTTQTDSGPGVIIVNGEDDYKTPPDSPSPQDTIGTDTIF